MINNIDTKGMDAACREIVRLSRELKETTEEMQTDVADMKAALARISERLE